jgi:hypothetical protein
MSPSDLRKRARVAIISGNQKTLDDLRGYLRGVGVEASCTRHLGSAAELAPGIVALVVFPDDFVRETVITTVMALVQRHPRILPVLITSEPRHYEGQLSDVTPFLVLPRPVWAWAIYDAVRPHLTAGTPKPRPSSKDRSR